MRKLFSHVGSAAKQRLNADPAVNATVDRPSAQQTLTAPTSKDIYRYRYHHGANLGSLFVLERWLTPSMFPSACKGSSELSAVRGWIGEIGLEATREKYEQHWRRFVSDDDLDWLMYEGKCNAVRVPIGYWTLGPGYCKGTDFEGVAQVYTRAWEQVKSLTRRCAQRNIGVLIDLHGLPGGANPNDHSGTDSGKADFWHCKGHRELATRVVEFVARELCNEDNFIGLQIVNEVQGGKTDEMWHYYDLALDAVARIDPSLPVYVSDAWNLGKTVEAVTKRNVPGSGRPPVVIDTHLYWCFSEADKAKTASQITCQVDVQLCAATGKAGKVGSVIDRGACEIIVGEYSCVLSEETWQKSTCEGSREELIRAFGQAQSRKYQASTGGAFFWTYKMDWMDGGEWGFKEQTRKGNVVAPPRGADLLPREEEEEEEGGPVRRARRARDRKRGDTWAAHCRYWDANHPGPAYEHARFEAGWTLGFEDAARFHESGGPRCGGGGRDGPEGIGLLELWVLKRLSDARQSGPFAWEWETGFRQGVRDFSDLLAGA